MASPIFDPETGFGGDGDPNGPMHDGTHCVTDLPFKNMTPQWLGERYDPHCLTRWFSDDWLAHYLNPESLETIMVATTYSEFFLALEMRAHDIIPMGIRGDFTSFTAPNGRSSSTSSVLYQSLTFGRPHLLSTPFPAGSHLVAVADERQGQSRA
jgi:hypothetical protein